MTIKGQKYYRATKNVFVKVSTIKQVKDLKLVLTKNSYVYNKLGKRVKYKSQSLLKEGKHLSTHNNGKVVTIKNIHF